MELRPERAYDQTDEVDKDRRRLNRLILIMATVFFVPLAILVSVSLIPTDKTAQARRMILLAPEAKCVSIQDFRPAGGFFIGLKYPKSKKPDVWMKELLRKNSRGGKVTGSGNTFQESSPASGKQLVFYDARTDVYTFSRQ